MPVCLLYTITGVYAIVSVRIQPIKEPKRELLSFLFSSTELLKNVWKMKPCRIARDVLNLYRPADFMLKP